MQPLATYFSGLRHFWAIALWLTPDGLCMTFDPINALPSSQWFFLPNWWPWGIPKHFELWLTLADPCMTFDPSYVLRLDSNLVAIGHS